MKKDAFFRMVLLLIAVAVVSGCAMLNAIPTPMPEKLNIIQPDPGIGKIAEFSGIWLGRWNSDIITVIVFEKITATEVDAIYSWASVKKSGGNWKRIKGKIKNATTIVLEWEERAVTLTLASNNLIYGEWWKGSSVVRANFSKIPTPTP